jgi:hypothetical protein
MAPVEMSGYCSISWVALQRELTVLPCTLRVQEAARRDDAPRSAHAWQRQAYLGAAARRRGMQAGVPPELLRPILRLHARILSLGSSAGGAGSAGSAGQPGQAPLPAPGSFVDWLLSVYDLMLEQSLGSPTAPEPDLAEELSPPAGDAAQPHAPRRASADMASSRWWRPSAWVEALSSRVEQIAASALLHMRPPARAGEPEEWDFGVFNEDPAAGQEAAEELRRAALAAAHELAATTGACSGLSWCMGRVADSEHAAGSKHADPL